MLLSLTASAQPPPMPAPPPGLEEAQAYVAYDALWPTADGIETVTLYVVRHPLCGMDPPAERFSCRGADLDGDGIVGQGDFGLCTQLGGKRAEACTAALLVYYEQHCERETQ